MLNKSAQTCAMESGGGMKMMSVAAAPIVARCKNDPQRSALLFNNAADAHAHYISLLRNGSDALICPNEANGGACVCEVRSALSAMEGGIPAAMP